MASYGARTGVTTLKKYVELLCHVYTVFSPKIRAWVSTNVDAGSHTLVFTFLDSLSGVCAAIKAAEDD